MHVFKVKEIKHDNNNECWVESPPSPSSPYNLNETDPDHSTHTLNDSHITLTDSDVLHITPETDDSDTSTDFDFDLNLSITNFNTDMNGHTMTPTHPPLSPTLTVYNNEECPRRQ